MSFKTFTGFKGKMAYAQIGDLRFVLLAENSKQLAALWSHIMTQAAPLDPAGIKSAILIEAATLPDAKAGDAISLTPGFSRVKLTSPPIETVSTVAPIDS